MVRLCQKRGAHWEEWEKGNGPGQIRLGVIAPRSPDAEVVLASGGWGDKVTTALKKIGITEERYVAVKEKFGLPPNCNCAGRREWLNKVGRWWNGEEE
jgi:hypothetical protein